MTSFDAYCHTDNDNHNSSTPEYAFFARCPSVTMAVFLLITILQFITSCPIRQSQPARAGHIGCTNPVKGTN